MLNTALGTILSRIFKFIYWEFTIPPSHETFILGEEMVNKSSTGQAMLSKPRGWIEAGED